MSISIDNSDEYVCINCNYKTKLKSNYNKHCKTTLHLTGKKKARSDKICDGYKCDKCDYETINKLNYNQHMLNNHSSTEEKEKSFKYFCKECNFGINTENLYDKHCQTTKHKRKTQ